MCSDGKQKIGKNRIGNTWKRYDDISDSWATVPVANIRSFSYFSPNFKEGTFWSTSAQA